MRRRSSDAGHHTSADSNGPLKPAL